MGAFKFKCPVLEPEGLYANAMNINICSKGTSFRRVLNSLLVVAPSCGRSLLTLMNGYSERPIFSFTASCPVELTQL